MNPNADQAKLIRMASEIAAYFAAYPAEQAAQSIADHINRFWPPQMRADFLAATAGPDTSLPPLLQTARARIKTKKTAPRPQVSP